MVRYLHFKDMHSCKCNYYKIFCIQKVKYLKNIETLIHYITETQGKRVEGQVP